MEKLKKRFWNVISSGLPLEHDLEILRKICLINVIIIFGLFFLSALGTLAFVQKNPQLGTVDLTMLLFLLVLFIHLRKTKHIVLVARIGTISIGLFYLFLIAQGGVHNTAYVWSFTYSLIALFLLGIKLGTLLSFTLLGLSILIFLSGGKIPFIASYPTDLIIRFIPAYIATFLFAYVMEKARQIVQDRLANLNIKLKGANAELDKANKDKEGLIHELNEKIEELKVLRGIVPMCSKCKKVRNDKGFWEQVEKYIMERSEAKFSHGLCPECAKELFGDI